MFRWGFSQAASVGAVIYSPGPQIKSNKYSLRYVTATVPVLDWDDYHTEFTGVFLHLKNSWKLADSCSLIQEAIKI